MIGPSGAAILSAPLYDEGLFLTDIATADIRRERIGLPLLRDERPEFQVRELADRSGAGRAGARLDQRPRRGARSRRRAGRSDAAPDRLPAASGRGLERMTAPPAFELPTELAIDTDVARRIIGEFIRGQLRQAGFERAVLGLSGGIDSALVAYLTAEAIGAERLLSVLMPYRTSSPASQADAEEVVRRLGTASELVDITPMVDGFFGTDSDASALRRGNFMARQRMAVLYDRLGDVGRSRGRHGQQDRVAHRLHDDLRRQRVRVQPDRRPVQEPGPPARGRDRRPGRDHPQGAVGRPVARPDRRDRGCLRLSDAGPTAVLAHRQAPFDRRGGRPRLPPRDGRASGPDGGRCRVQAPGSADRQARPTHGRRRLPVSAPTTGLRSRG